MRIVLGPLDICHYYSTLARGFDEIDVDAHLVCVDPESLSDKGVCAKSGFVRRYLKAFGAFGETRGLSRLSPRRYWCTLGLLLHRALLVCWILLRVDAVILKSGLSFFHSGLDLRLFKMCGKVLVFVFHGSDSRPPYFNAFYANKPVALLYDQTMRTKAAVSQVSGFADYIIDNPLSAQFQTHSRCCLYQVIGNPIDDTRLFPTLLDRPSGSEQHSSATRPLRILHAPSVAALKGTDVIRDCIARLRNEGYTVEYKEVTGVPNSVVIAEIAQADLVIDELFSDMHGATFAMEAIACGRVVIVGGYCFDELDKFVPKQFIPPTIRCYPETLYDTIKPLLDEPSKLRQIGKDAQRFYMEVGSANHTAERMLRLISGKAPNDWFFDSGSNELIGVVAGTPDQIRTNVSKLIEGYGHAALGLNDKPALLKTLLHRFEDQPAS
jgi:hypothetical protein